MESGGVMIIVRMRGEGEGERGEGTKEQVFSNNNGHLACLTRSPLACQTRST